MEKERTFKQMMEEEHKNRIELFKFLFSEKLKDLRREKHLTQKTMAHNLGIAISTYANWEQGRTEPSIYDIFNLLWVFKIEANELFDIDYLFNSNKIS